MFTIYKAGTIAIVTAISTSLLLSVSSVAMAAEAPVVAAAPATTIVQGAVSRGDARKIVNDYLKANGKRNMRAGRTHGDGEFWTVKISTPMGVHAGEMKVNVNSGELSKS